MASVMASGMNREANLIGIKFLPIRAVRPAGKDVVVTIFGKGPVL